MFTDNTYSCTVLIETMQLPVLVFTFEILDLLRVEVHNHDTDDGVESVPAPPALPRVYTN
jgi:hypothetical protein